MSKCVDVGSFIESKTSEVQTSHVGFTSEVSDYLVVHMGPGDLVLVKLREYSALQSIISFSSHLISSRLCPSTAGCSPPSMSSIVVCLLPSSSGGSLLLCYVILPSSAWSSSRPLPSPWLPLFNLFNSVCFPSASVSSSSLSLQTLVTTNGGIRTHKQL